jgi:hypothetical protein
MEKIMFKFVSKTVHGDSESALFYNGQKLVTVYAGVGADGETEIQIEDGQGRLMKEWVDFLEDYEILN